MIERFSQLAETAAAGLSRRQFLGRFGQIAVALAGAVAAWLTFPGHGLAARASCPAGYRLLKCSRDEPKICCPRGTTCRDLAFVTCVLPS